jgi:hypothetical protein
VSLANYYYLKYCSQDPRPSDCVGSPLEMFALVALIVAVFTLVYWLRRR